MNKASKKSLNLVDIEARLLVLEGRYNTYKGLMQMPETDWDRESNRIYATDEVWGKIFTNNIWAQAYYKEGEPEYLTMCAAFGLKHLLKHEPSRDIIALSSTINSHDPCSDEEVTSPVMKGTNMLSHRLFPNQPGPSVAPHPPRMYPPRNASHGPPGENSSANSSPDD